MFNESEIVPQQPDQMVALVYELLDAHSDTVLLANGLAHDKQWGAHVDYLRNLQRLGREALARLSDARAAHGLLKEI
jgi:hypothetical protein